MNWKIDTHIIFLILSTGLLVGGFLWSMIYARTEMNVILGTFGPLASMAWGWYFNKKYQIKKKLTAKFK